MAANAIDLCTAATVAGDLGVTSDATVQRCVTAASRAIAAYCGRAFERATSVIEYPVSFKRSRLLLARAPVVSIASIYEYDALVDSADYESVGANADAGIVLRLNGCWVSTQEWDGLTTLSPDRGDGRTDEYGVKVTYTAGYVTPGQNAVDAVTYTSVTLPEDVQEAAVMTSVGLYRSRGVDQMISSESIGDWSVSYFAQKANASSLIPGVAQALLAPYRFVRVA